MCGADMHLEEAEPDVGILVDAWVCDGCEHCEVADPPDEES